MNPNYIYIIVHTYIQATSPKNIGWHPQQGDSQNHQAEEHDQQLQEYNWESKMYDQQLEYLDRQSEQTTDSWRT